MSKEFLNDYECPEHGVFEAWGSVDQSGRCPECGGRAARLIGTKGIMLGLGVKGNDVAFPRAARMWADQHERAARLPEKD